MGREERANEKSMKLMRKHWISEEKVEAAEKKQQLTKHQLLPPIQVQSGLKYMQEVKQRFVLDPSSICFLAHWHQLTGIGEKKWQLRYWGAVRVEMYAGWAGREGWEQSHYPTGRISQVPPLTKVRVILDKFTISALVWCLWIVWVMLNGWPRQKKIGCCDLQLIICV